MFFYHRDKKTHFMLLLLRSYVCLSGCWRQPTLERAYQRDESKMRTWKILLEHLDLAILSVDFWVTWTSTFLFKLSWVSVICNQKNPDGCMAFFLYQMPIKGSSVALSAQKKSIPPFLSPSTLPLYSGKNFPSVQLCGSNRRCHCISLTFSANFSWLR